MTNEQRASGLRALGLSAAAALTVLTAGCGNGLVSTGQPTGADPSVSVPSSTSQSAAPPASSKPSSTSTTKSTSSQSDSGGSGSTSPSTETSPAGPATSTGGAGSGGTGSGGTGSGGTGSGGASSGGTASTANTCKLGDLAVGVRASEGGAAAGSNYVLLTFRNTSASTCYLRGYAGVTFVGDQNGTQLGDPAARVRSRELTAVKLSAGETEKELLQIVNAGNFDAADCAPTTADGFRVYPPAETKAAYVPFKTQACQSKGLGQLSVYPVGTSG